MWVRRRIAALALFGVQLLQGVLPAAGAACDLSAATPAASTTAVDAAPAAITVHHHHSAAPEPDAGTPTSAPVPHQNAPAACSMAMACAVVGIMSSAVTVSTVDVAIDTHRPVHVADWPISLDFAPEPPPPRG